LENEQAQFVQITAENGDTIITLTDDAIITLKNAATQYTITSAGDAIYHTGSGGIVTAAVPVSSGSDAIYVSNTGTGEISITATSSVQSTGADGIKV